MEGTKLQNSLFERHAEQEKLREAIQRAGVSKELVLIVGSSGTGKTALAESVSKDALLAKGKYDPLERPDGVQPILNAVESLIASVIENDPHRIQESIRQRMNPDTDSLLFDVIPSLAHLFRYSSGPSAIGQPHQQQRGSASQKRLAFSLRSLLACMTSIEHPVVLFLDDLQWAGDASIDLLSLLLTDAPTEGLAILGTCRDNEVSVAHRLSIALRELEARGVAISPIALHNWTREQVVSVVDEVLGGEDDDLASLLCEETNGHVTRSFYYSRLCTKVVPWYATLTCGNSNRSSIYVLGPRMHHHSSPIG